MNGEAPIPVLNRPISDDCAYLSERHGVFLHSLSNIQTMSFHWERRHATVTGHLGFLDSRGRHPQSLESQLAKQVESRIHFGSRVAYEQLLKDYTHVVLATGDAAYACC